MLVEWGGHACAVCRLSVAKVRRLWPSAFSLLMVFSLLLGDGLLPVLAARYKAEVALFSSPTAAGDRTSSSSNFFGGDSGSFPRSNVQSLTSSENGVGKTEGLSSVRKNKAEKIYGSISNSMRTKVGFASRPKTLIMREGMDAESSMRMYNSESGSGNKLADLHIRMQHLGPRAAVKHNEIGEGSNKRKRKSYLSTTNVGSDAAALSLKSSPSLRSSLPSSPVSVVSSYTPLSSSSINSAPSFISSVPSLKSSFKLPSSSSLPSPSSASSAASAFSILASSDKSSNNYNIINSKNVNSKNKYTVYHTKYQKHQQRREEMGSGWYSHRLPVNPTKGYISGKTFKQQNQNRNIKHKFQQHSSQHPPLQEDQPFDDNNRQLANVKYLHQSEQPSRKCPASKDEKRLVLDNKLVSSVCNNNNQIDCYSVLQKSYLNFCSNYNAASVSCFFDLSARGNETCELKDCKSYFNQIIDQDRRVEEYYKGFLDLIGRYDCTQTYSVKWTCENCKKAYKDWLCANTIKFYEAGTKIPPCTDFCSHVEEMCPFFRPKIDTHAGDPSFICKDPEINLPIFLGDQCYRLCHSYSLDDITSAYCPTSCGENCSFSKECSNISSPEQEEGESDCIFVVIRDSHSLPTLTESPIYNGSRVGSENSTSGSARLYLSLEYSGLHTSPYRFLPFILCILVGHLLLNPFISEFFLNDLQHKLSIILILAFIASSLLPVIWSGALISIR